MAHNAINNDIFNKVIEKPSRGQICKILDIDDSPGWEIADYDDKNKLALIHYTVSKQTVPEYGNYRGTVVDLKYNCVVADSYGYTPVAISDNLKESNGVINITDVDGIDHKFNLNKTRFHMGFEGTLIRMFKWNGQVFISTHRRLYINNSKWGNETKTFLEMYKELNGPETLFGDGDYSPYCHFFMLSHPQVVVGTKYNLSKGLLVYLGYKQMWNPEDTDLGIDKEKMDMELKTPDLAINLDTNHSQPITFQPKLLSLDEVNRHLSYGFWSHDGSIDVYDKRLGTGEFIIAYTYDEISQQQKLLRIHSTAYEWRLNMRGNHPNLYCQFVRLINGSYYDFRKVDKKKLYYNSFPLMNYVDSDNIKQYLKDGNVYAVWSHGTNLKTNKRSRRSNVNNEEFRLSTRDGRYYNIWLCFLMAVPLHRQLEVSEYLDKFNNDRQDVINWIQELEDKESFQDIKEFLSTEMIEIMEKDENLELKEEFIKSINSSISSRVIQIINETRIFANRKYRNNQNKTKDGTILDMKQLTRNNIGNLIRKEDGRSLYTLMKNRKRYYYTINKLETRFKEPDQ